MNSILPPGGLKPVGRRELIRGLGASAAMAAFPSLRDLAAAAQKGSQPIHIHAYFHLAA